MKRCVVIGNGPSLKGFDFDRLRGWDTFGSNMIYLSGFLPKFYAVEDVLVAMDRGREISDAIPMPRYAPDHLRDFLIGEWVWLKPENYMMGRTVTVLLLQIAYRLRYQKVYLIGIDHRYQLPPHEGELHLQSLGDDPDHFTPDYFGKGRHFHPPNLPRMEQAYQGMRKLYENIDGQIINLTPNTALDVFEKMEMEQVL